MNIEFKEGLLFTSIQISYRGSTKLIENIVIVIDTGAAETIISPDAVEDIGIYAELEDSVNSFYGIGGSLHNYFSKNRVQVELGNVCLEEAKMDFGVVDPQGNINGLLGLDYLMKLGAILDLKKLSLIFNV
jgi:predicted aspartyl protease